MPTGPDPSSVAGRLARRLAERLYATPLYRPLLAGKAPAALLVTPEDPWPGDAAEADRLFQGRYRFAGEEIAARDSPWTAATPSPAWTAELDGFAWLRHFAAAGGDAARRQARALVAAWLDRHRDWDAAAWRPDVLARRLIAWLCHADFITADADAALRTAFYASLARQARHLWRAAGQAPPGAPTLTALVGLGFAALCLPDMRRRWPKAAERLVAALDQQVLPDGGHVGRNPSQHLALLRDLVALRAACAAAGLDPPPPLQHAIDRLAPMLRFFRHGDGGLALFHGGEAESEAGVDLALGRADARGKPLASAIQSGFERIAARRGLLIVDVGRPPARALGGTPHAAPLAFEFSAGRERLIVNCGACRRDSPEWRRALAATAAHSTLTLGDSNSVDIEAARADMPPPIVERNEQDGATWLGLSHDGYQRRFALTHRRRLYLDAAGQDLRGEDLLAGSGRRARGTPFALRFHLHPALQASLLQNGAAVLIKTGSGQGWRFRAAGGTLSVEESVYFGDRGEMRRAQQIVVAGVVDERGAAVKWALARVPASPSAPA
jgi:uncharacterized heparinase superfamily protein